jgi:hypothetical protein
VQKNIKEGLFAFLKSDCIIWGTNSKSKYHGLIIEQNNYITLHEAG